MNSSYDGKTVAVPGVLRGYRLWRYDARSLELVPVYVHLGPWTAGINVAYCSTDMSPTSLDRLLGWPGHGKHTSGEMVHKDDWVKYPAPQRGCSCGFYATFDYESYRSQRPSVWMNYGPGFPKRFVHGSIKASGRIVLGEKGFRAEKAEIEALWGLGSQAAARIYGVPWFLTRRRFLKHFPPQDVSHLLGERRP